MSARHPVIAITGSSGSGTPTAKAAFEEVFHRENIRAAFVEGEAFHRYDRTEMRRRIAEAHATGNTAFSHFGPEANLFEELESLFRGYGDTGTGSIRKYLHETIEAERYGQEPGTFTPWEAAPTETDLLFYRGLHGGVVSESIDVARHVDLLIGVVPAINLEWIQKLHRDKRFRGYSHEAVIDTILRRLPDYLNYICPQFTRTHVNFQRVPVVDSSDPFIAESVPTFDESLLVIAFKDPTGIDFPYLRAMLHDSFMSQPNTLVCPGGKMGLAMELIFTPMVWKLMEGKQRARAHETVGAL
ncbi:MAG: phosphoribulokinase [Candidatus Velthaea sp.]|jgi:phosphoribulokinase